MKQEEKFKPKWNDETRWAYFRQHPIEPERPTCPPTEPIIYSSTRTKSGRIAQMVVTRLPGQAMAQYWTGKEYRNEQEAVIDCDRLNSHSPAMERHSCIFRLESCPADCDPACMRRRVLTNIIHTLGSPRRLFR